MDAEKSKRPVNKKRQKRAEESVMKERVNKRKGN
jgi:hypothetical protein